MDILSKSQRSFNMSRIKATDSKAELLLKFFLKDLEIPFIENAKDLPGKPDIYIPDLNLAIFLHGCFWHGHSGCSYYVVPKSNTEFWTKKINGNINRDKRVVLDLVSLNIDVCVVWECEIKNGNFFEKITNLLNSY